MPSKFYHYMSLMRIGSPTGWLLVFLPTMFGIILGAEKMDDLKMSFIFLVASICARTAGCIINDITDKKLDIHVTRTKNRVLASGKIDQIEGCILLAMMLLACFAILVSLKIMAIIIGLIAFCLMLIYPLMKRLTYFPQVFLGLTFNLGILVGYSSIKDALSQEILTMYAACGLWTLGYDTIYAFMDLKDDKKIGIKSTAVFFEQKAYRFWIGVFYTAFVAVFTYVLVVEQRFIAIIGVVAALPVLIWQIITVDIHDARNCSIRFKSNVFVGLSLAVGLFSDFIINYDKYVV